MPDCDEAVRKKALERLLEEAGKDNIPTSVEIANARGFSLNAVLLHRGGFDLEGLRFTNKSVSGHGYFVSKGRYERS